jgi:hypothetical protein
MEDKAYYEARSVELHKLLDAATDSATIAELMAKIDENIRLLNNAPGESIGAAATLAAPPPPTIK